jgi:hypothetical protein
MAVVAAAAGPGGAAPGPGGGFGRRGPQARTQSETRSLPPSPGVTPSRLGLGVREAGGPSVGPGRVGLRRRRA